jgi:hypothetical protein
LFILMILYICLLRIPQQSQNQRQSQSQSYFTTGCLPLINPSWRQAIWDQHFFKVNNWFQSFYLASCLTRGWDLRARHISRNIKTNTYETIIYPAVFLCGETWTLLVYKTEINGRGVSLRWPRDTLYPLKLALTSPTNGGRSVGIVRLRTKTTEFVYECASFSTYKAQAVNNFSFSRMTTLHDFISYKCLVCPRVKQVPRIRRLMKILCRERRNACRLLDTEKWVTVQKVDTSYN